MKIAINGIREMGWEYLDLIEKWLKLAIKPENKELCGIF
jgi:hypothetical protein